MKHFIYLFLLLVVFAQSAWAQTIDRIVAKVGQDVVTLSDVNKALDQQKKYLLQTFGPQKGAEEFAQFKKNVLNEMVLDRILKAEIEKEKVTVSSEEVDQEYLKRVNQSGLSLTDFGAKLVQSDFTVSDYKKGIRKELEKQAFIQKKIVPKVSISDYDLQKEYQENISQFQTYQKLRFIEVLLVPTSFANNDELLKVAEQIQERLKKGQTPTDLINKYSAGAFAKTGGDSGLVSATDLRPEIQRVLSNLGIGQTSPLLPIEQGVFIFKLLAKADPRPVAFNEVVNQIRGVVGDKLVAEELRKYLMNVKDQTFVEMNP